LWQILSQERSQTRHEPEDAQDPKRMRNIHAKIANRRKLCGSLSCSPADTSRVEAGVYSDPGVGRPVGALNLDRHVDAPGVYGRSG
jgi:hypothetical protein